MHIIWLILKIIGLSIILKVVLTQLNNLVFMALKKPYVWLFCMLLVGLVFIWSLSGINDASTILGWAGTLAFFAMIPPGIKGNENKKMANDMIDETYEEMGMPGGRNMYKIGLFLFLAGMALAWLFCFTQKMT